MDRCLAKLIAALLVVGTSGVYGRTNYDDNDIQDIVDLHNNYRSAVSPTAANMRQLTWDDNLAHMAQLWAENCDWSHGQIFDYSTFRSVGQNLYYRTGTRVPTALDFVGAWHDEVDWFDFGSQTCSPPPGQSCGHYTQVVWAKTHKVGCGAKFCPTLNGAIHNNALLVVCNYGKAGNFVGAKPYSRGASCSKCPANAPNCAENLCY